MVVEMEMEEALVQMVEVAVEVLEEVMWVWQMWQDSRDDDDSRDGGGDAAVINDTVNDVQTVITQITLLSSRGDS